MYNPLILGLFAAAVAANSYTTTLLLLGSGDISVLGSIITSDATATTYSLTCPVSGAPADGCGFPTSFSFTQGPSTMHFQLPIYDSAANPGTIDLQCQITGSGGSCTEGRVISGATSARVSTSYKDFASEGVVVTITDGPLPAATGATNTIPSTSATSTTSSLGGETSSTGSSSSTTKVSTGGMPMITSRPQWVIGGAVAAAAAFAAM